MKPVYLSGCPGSTRIFVKGKIIVHLDPTYSSFPCRSKHLEDIYQEQSIKRNHSELVVPRNRVIIGGIQLIFQSEGLGWNSTAHLFEVSAQTSLKVIGCDFQRAANKQVNCELFGNASYFPSPIQGSGPGVLLLESCTVSDFDSIYTAPAIAHNMIINRCQIMECWKTAITCIDRNVIIIEHSSFKKCKNNVITIISGVEGERSNYSYHTPLPSEQRNFIADDHEDNESPHIAPRYLSKPMAMKDKLMPERSKLASAGSFLSLKNVNFWENSGSCILATSDQRESVSRSYATLSDCFFEENAGVCVNEVANRRLSLQIVSCRFLRNKSVCINIEYSTSSRIASCKFEENFGYLLTLSDSGTTFTKNICSNNGQSVKLTTRAGFLHLINIIQNRFDGTSNGAGIEIFPGVSLRLDIQTNIITKCLNGITIDGTASGVADLTQYSRNQHSPAGYHHSNHHNLESSSVIDMYDNDVTDCLEYGLKLIGSSFLIRSRKDLIEGNQKGALYCISRATPMNWKPDLLDPPKIVGKMFVNNQEIDYRNSSNSSCSLI